MVLYCIVLYNTEACCTVLFCTILYIVLPRFVLCLLKVEMLGKGGGRVNLSGNLQEVV